MSVRTRASEALRIALAPGPSQRMTQGELARVLGIAQPSVHKWVRGATRPVPVFRTALRRLLGIPVTHWETPEERRVARRLKRVRQRQRPRRRRSLMPSERDRRAA